MGKDETLARWLIDTIKRLGDVSDNEVELRRHILSTYLSMRWGMLLIALAFPVVLWIGGWAFHGWSLLDSMSAYYWEPIEKGKEGVDAPMRVWFVGLLFALGTCLFLYKGYTRLEEWLLNVAGIFAIGVALFPRCWEIACPGWGLHYIFAVGFFSILAVVALLHGAYAWGLLRNGRCSQRLEDRQKLYATLYLFSAFTMPIVPALAWKIFGAFWGEFAGILAFCFFWGVQIRQIGKSQFDQKLAK